MAPLLFGIERISTILPAKSEKAAAGPDLSAGGGLLESLRDRLVESGLNEGAADLLFWIVVIGGLLVLCVLTWFLTRFFIRKVLSLVAGKTRTSWDDILLESRFFSRLSFLAPALVVFFSASVFQAEEMQTVVRNAALAWMVVVGMLAASSLLNALLVIYQTLEMSRTTPIKGFVGVVRILLFVAGGILVLATLLDLSPWAFLSGIGALTAVLLLVFKDTLLGLVASIQITTGDMLREGDWIGVPQYGADGDVIDVSLHTVKVRNWDKTVTTIPTYALVSESFKNWRGMEESGGRRIKRAVHIDMNSIRFCTEAMLERFEKFHLLTGYIRTKREELDLFNSERGLDTTVPVNERRLTNVGTFRAYVVAYLSNHPQIHQEMTFLVRQLAPGERGLPIEIYVFSRVQEWGRYEAIQADIFDHILSVVPEFDLRVFQNPSGNDFQAMAVSGR